MYGQNMPFWDEVTFLLPLLKYVQGFFFLPERTSNIIGYKPAANTLFYWDYIAICLLQSMLWSDPQLETFIEPEDGLVAL